MQGALADALESYLAVINVSPFELDLDCISWHRTFAVNPCDDRRVSKLDARSSIVNIRNDRIEARLLAPFKCYCLGEVQCRPLDLAGSFFRTRHDRWQLLKCLGKIL